MHANAQQRAIGRAKSGGRMFPAAMLCAVAMLAASGCAVQRRERLPMAATPQILQNASLDELIGKVRAQQEAIRTLNATVEIQPTVTSELRGEIVTYRDVRAFLLIRKPADLRMIGQYPVVRSTAFDLASDGERFGLYIPSKNRFVTGDSRGGKRRESALENLRPQHVLDALLWQAPNVGSEEAAMELASEGQKSYYIVLILRRGAAGKLILARKLWFERIGLTLERLQIFDDAGAVATDARYSDYGDFSGIAYPRIIALDRPQDDYGLVLTISSLTLNQPLDDEKFQMERPAGAEVVDLDAEQARFVKDLAPQEGFLGWSIVSYWQI
jgi:outer membrane lipoprotein-sorting protein